MASAINSSFLKFSTRTVDELGFTSIMCGRDGNNFHRAVELIETNDAEVDWRVTLDISRGKYLLVTPLLDCII